MSSFPRVCFCRAAEGSVFGLTLQFSGDPSQWFQRTLVVLRSPVLQREECSPCSNEASPDSLSVGSASLPAAARSERHPRALSSVRQRRRILMSSSSRETDDEEDNPPAPVPIVSFGSSSSSSVEARVFSPSEGGQLGTASTHGSISCPCSHCLALFFGCRAGGYAVF